MPRNFPLSIRAPLRLASRQVLIDQNAERFVGAAPCGLLVHCRIAAKSHPGLKPAGIFARYAKVHRFGRAKHHAPLLRPDAILVDPGLRTAFAYSKAEAFYVVVKDDALR